MITKSNNQPRTSTMVTTRTCPQVPYPLPGMMTPPLPWAPCLITLTINNFFLNAYSKPPLVQIETISSHPITFYLREETDPHLATTSFEIVVDSDKVSPQSLFFFRLHPPSCLSWSSYEFCSSPFTSSVTLLKMPSTLVDVPKCYQKELISEIFAVMCFPDLSAIN